MSVALCPQCRAPLRGDKQHGSGFCKPSANGSLPKCCACGATATMTDGRLNYCRRDAPTDAQVLVIGRAAS